MSTEIFQKVENADDFLGEAISMNPKQINAVSDNDRAQRTTLQHKDPRVQSDANALTKLNEVSSRLWNLQSLREGLEEMLAASIELLGADFGNIQILDPRRQVLLIEAQRGFQNEFLDFFCEVAADDDSSCGRALRTGERIIVQDVETDPNFSAMLHIVRNAGYRAVQSTPIIGRDGRPLGMISTHFRSVHLPSENELRQLDLCARQVADFIERKRAESLIECQKQSLEMVVAGAPLEGDGGVLDFLARSMESQLDGAIVAIHLLEPDGHHFGYVAAPQLPPTYAQATRGMDARMELGCCSSAVVSNTPTIVRDFTDDLPRARWPAFTAEVIGMGLRSCFTTPITSKDNIVLGTFAIYYREPTDPTLRDQQLVNFVAGTVSLAIERMQSEKALRESEERFRMLADNMAQLAWICDKLGNVTWYNQRWLEYTGMSFEEMKSWGWTKCHHPNHLDRVVASVNSALESGEIWEETFPLRAKDGSYRWFLTRALPIRDATGEITCWFGTNTEIEELRRAREAAETANRVKDEFLATLSHELRTPLNAIMGWTHLLTRGKLDEETFARGLETIARNAFAQNQLISDLLDISRIISGQLRFEKCVVDLTNVIEAATETVRPAADSKEIILKLNLERSAGLVSGDAMRLQQIVWNLLSNAIKFTPQGGQVTVQLKRENSRVFLSVSDSGDGISAEFLPFIFDRFRQAESTTKRQHGGLGLGLAIVRHLVEAHGGTIRAASKGLGMGATFTVTLPLLAVHREAFGAEQTFFPGGSVACVSPEILKGLRVLVIDDEEDTRDLLTVALTESGAEVRSAATVRVALEITSQWKPHVLVSDIGMPGEDGYDLIRALRAMESEKGGTIPALALTGYASAEDAARTRMAGYQTHMAKPVAPSELVMAVARLAAEAPTSGS